MHGTIPPLPQHVFIAWCLIKQRLPLHAVVLSEAQRKLYLICPLEHQDKHHPESPCLLHKLTAESWRTHCGINHVMK